LNFVESLARLKENSARQIEVSSFLSQKHDKQETATMATGVPDTPGAPT
jgi:hypothetical protein